MAEKFDAVAEGKIKRLIIDLAPRRTKPSSPARMPVVPGKFARRRSSRVSNTEHLAAGFGRRVRNMIDGATLVSDEDGRQAAACNEIFPKIQLAPDSKAAAG